MRYEGNTSFFTLANICNQNKQVLTFFTIHKYLFCKQNRN